MMSPGQQRNPRIPNENEQRARMFHSDRGSDVGSLTKDTTPSSFIEGKKKQEIWKFNIVAAKEEKLKFQTVKTVIRFIFNCCFYFIKTYKSKV